MIISHMSVVKINLTLLLLTLRPNATKLNLVIELWIFSLMELVMLVRCSYKKFLTIIVIIILLAFRAYHGMLFMRVAIVIDKCVYC